MNELSLDEDDRSRVETRLHLEILKQAVRDAPQSQQARLGLAAAYRELGHPDQAGRWGALTEGWATQFELDRFARLLGASAVGASEIRSFLWLPSGATLPESVTDLIAGPAADYQAEFGIRGRSSSRELSLAGSGAGVVGWLAGGAGALSLVTVLAVYFVALAGQPVAPLIARIGGTAVVAFALAALAAWIITRTLDRRRQRGRSARYAATGGAPSWPRLPEGLSAQLAAVDRSTAGGISYAPSQVTLRSGETIDRVCFVAAEEFIENWGRHHVPSSFIDPSDIASIESSPTRLPAPLANKLYAEGESGMGYTIFTVGLADGTRIPYLTGNVVDFPQWPAGVGPADVVDVFPHEGREFFQTVDYPETQKSAPFQWIPYAR